MSEILFQIVDDEYEIINIRYFLDCKFPILPTTTHICKQLTYDRIIDFIKRETDIKYLSRILIYYGKNRGVDKIVWCNDIITNIIDDDGLEDTVFDFTDNERSIVESYCKSNSLDYEYVEADLMRKLHTLTTHYNDEYIKAKIREEIDRIEKIDKAKLLFYSHCK